MIGEDDNGDLILGISTSSNSGSIAWIDIFEQKIIHSESWQALRPHAQKNTTTDTADRPEISATTDTRPWTHTAALPSIFAKKRHLLSRTLRVAVGLGPGSHSGIRAAIVAARALELTREIPLYGICCHDAIALAFNETEEFCVITDAGRDMAALSRYHRHVRTDGPRLATWQEAQHIALTTTTIASHPLTQMPQIRVVPPDAIHTARAHIAARHSGQHTLPIEPITLHQTNFKKLPTAQ